jgi:hypothetical protein
MRTILLALSLLVWGSFGFAGEVLREFSWLELKEKDALADGEVIRSQEPGVAEFLKVANLQDAPRSIHVLTLESPGITRPRYAIAGQIRYEGVDKESHLELWNEFAGRGSFFSRTQASAGPMKSIHGSSGWRRFVVPFYVNEGDLRPSRLTLNVVLAGRGTVFLGPLQLVQYAENEDPLASGGEWWAERTAGWLGAILGVALGFVGAAVGYFTSRGKARGFVLGALKLTMAVGVLALLAGIAAVLQRQPYHVFYPLLLLGLLGSVIPLGLLKTCRKRFDEIELRKMAAIDAG